MPASPEKNSRAPSPARTKCAPPAAPLPLVRVLRWALTPKALAFGASAFGVSALATVAAPVVLPMAIAAGAVSLIRSLFD